MISRRHFLRSLALAPLALVAAPLLARIPTPVAPQPTPRWAGADDRGTPAEQAARDRALLAAKQITILPLAGDREFTRHLNEYLELQSQIRLAAHKAMAIPPGFLP